MYLKLFNQRGWRIEKPLVPHRTLSGAGIPHFARNDTLKKISARQSHRNSLALQLRLQLPHIMNPEVKD